MTEHPFVAHRSLLFTVAYEMFGSAAAPGPVHGAELVARVLANASQYEFASATKGLAGGCPGGVGDGDGAALYATREGASADGQAERAGQEHGDRHEDEAVCDGGTGDLVGMLTL
jgi:hypothetical protein